MNDNLKIIKLWIEKADHDLGTAELTQKHIPVFRDTIAFHCQQAVEKYCKAYLIFNNIQPKRTHDLVLLLGMISTFESVSDDLFDLIAELQDYAVEVRYPDTIIELTDDDISKAIEITRVFRNLFLSKISGYISPEEHK
ncbi:MAG: HEPN domain-containing protein [Bacteroidales bacterium]|nr:HEPN domain-containing protein [Bacteroidales bacterium]